MTVQDSVRTVTVPRQAGPVDASLAPASAPVPLLGRDRPLTKDERQFVLGIAGVFTALTAIIVTFLLLAVHVWT